MSLVNIPSNARQLFDRIQQMRQELPVTNFNEYHNPIREDLHRLRVLSDEKKIMIELMDARITALDKLQPFVNDLQRLISNQDRKALRIISDHQGILCDEISKARIWLSKCEEQIVQAQKELPENMQKAEVRRIRKVAKCVLLEETKKSLSADAGKSSQLQEALCSYRSQILQMEAEIASYGRCELILDPLKSTKITIHRLARQRKDGVAAHLDFLTKRFHAFVQLTDQIQACKWVEAIEAARIIFLNHSEGLVMVRKIRQADQDEIHKHEKAMQVGQKVHELFLMFSSKFSMALPDETILSAEWIPHWEAIEVAYRDYRNKIST